MTELTAASVLAAASAAVGVPLAEPESLTGSARSMILRCRDETGVKMVIKAYPADDDGPASFAAEAAGLALTGDFGLGPRLLAVDEPTLTVVMSDLGRFPSLADLLLGDRPGPAGVALLRWARALGHLAVRAAGREAEHARLLTHYLAGRPDGSLPGRLADRVRDAAARAARLSVAAPAGLDAELREVSARLESDRYRVFSPGDVCPDNNLVTPDGVRFIDNESAGYHSVFLDAAYLRMPFSTCWCAFRLPAGLATAAEAGYRAEVGRIHPELVDDARWETGMRGAIAAWTMNSMGWLLDAALDGNRTLGDEQHAAPSSRQLMRHRWRILTAELTAAGDWPALATLAARLLAATEHWNMPKLGLYPALAEREELADRPAW